MRPGFLPVHEIPFLWLSALTGILIFLCWLGLSSTGRSFGILIDSREKFSLSRFQLIIWTWLVSASLLAMGVYKGAMSLDIPSELWVLMGVSVGSSAGAAVVKSLKEKKEPDQARVSFRSLRANRRGLNHVNLSGDEAKFIDLVSGEEILDYRQIDVSKVQLFVFTVVAWLIYAVSIWKSGADNSGLPDVSEGMVALMGVSHSGYLFSKSAPKTPIQA